jgi:hypothetical protein
MKLTIASALTVALLGLAAIGPETGAAAEVTIRTAGYTHFSATPAPTTPLNLPMQISSSVQLPIHVTGSVPTTTVGFHHRHAGFYGPRYVYRPYYAPYVAYRPYYYSPRPYVYGGFYPPNWGGYYGGPAFYRGPAAYGGGYWGGYPGGYHW